MCRDDSGQTAVRFTPTPKLIDQLSFLFADNPAEAMKVFNSTHWIDSYQRNVVARALADNSELSFYMCKNCGQVTYVEPFFDNLCGACK